jgi:hypothetical protein
MSAALPVACGLVLAACAAPPAKTAAVPSGRSIEDALVPGYVTIVDFWSASCQACAVVDQKISEPIAREHAVVVRKVDVGDGDTPVARAYAVSALPHFNVYDRARRLRYVLVGGDCLRAPELARALARE